MRWEVVDDGPVNVIQEIYKMLSDFERDTTLRPAIITVSGFVLRELKRRASPGSAVSLGENAELYIFGIRLVSYKYSAQRPGTMVYVWYMSGECPVISTYRIYHFRNLELI